ncbi:hypothetical protein CRG98_016553 [Punica granatum]|uniref:Uncharacterized protein n=1 Tax=Punica granatum TaxID=22663 RepID=A0A2I0K4I8_PUNGR|nr:hypothetical protein CRG98_016553 [Punica granatum]
MQNQQAKPGKVKKGVLALNKCRMNGSSPERGWLLKVNAESTGPAKKGEEEECLLKVNAESTGPTWKGEEGGEEGECLLKVNAESTSKARKPEEGGAFLK